MDIAKLINRPITEWKLEDLAAIGAAKFPESLTLEFKSDFEAGSEERWRKRQDEISSKSRDRLAAEIVAFANAYGGTLLMGVNEKANDDGIRVSAGLGEAIPSIAQCAERLESSLRAIIDPPLPMLEVKAIKATDDGAGYLVIKVPQSLLAPHGVGRPAAGYVRRGSFCEPMTMRDLQSVFWEARTAIDRVNDTFKSRQQEFVRDLGDRGQLPGFPAHVLYRFTVVPGRHFQIGHLPSLMIGSRIFQARGVPFQTQQSHKFTFGGPVWQPAAGGVAALEFENREYKQVRIWSDGTWNLRGCHIVDDAREYPASYAVGALWLLYNAMRLRRHLGRVDVPLCMEGEIIASKVGRVIFGGRYGGDFPAPTEPALTDRLELGKDEEFDDVAQLFAEQIGWACGLNIDFSDLRLGPNLNLRV